MTETFVREVDENLRRDQLRDFLVGNAAWLITGIALFLAASGGFIWWNHHQEQRYEAQVEQLDQIYKDIGAGDSTGTAPKVQELAGSGSKAVRASAQFTRAAVALQQGNLKVAASIYKDISADDGLPAPYRNVAVIRQTAVEFDEIPPQEVISRLEALTKPGGPWFGTAGEMTALALLKQGKTRDAGQLFAAIAKDQTVPQGVRARASQVAGSLGFDTGPATQLTAQ
jgi:hypothetical protein